MPRAARASHLVHPYSAFLSRRLRNIRIGVSEPAGTDVTPTGSDKVPRHPVRLHDGKEKNGKIIGLLKQWGSNRSRTGVVGGTILRTTT